jgi:hypothetical protein
MNYRIKEQYGCFFIEEEVTISTDVYDFKSRVFPFLFKPKKTNRKVWYEITQRGYISNVIMPSAKFKTKEEAKKAIENLSPKYHEVSQEER